MNKEVKRLKLKTIEAECFEDWCKENPPAKQGEEQTITNQKIGEFLGKWE